MIAIVWAGFVATTLAMAFFWVARSLGWTSFSPTIQVGCLFTRDPRKPLTETIGFILVLIGGSTLVPALYGAILGRWGGPGWIGGLVLGGFLGLAVAAALPLFGTISACVRTGSIPPPGTFGIGWGRPTPAVILAGHMIYGAVVGAVLRAF